MEALKLVRIKVKIPVHQPGGAIEYKEVEFEVFYDGTFYNAIAIQSQSLARLTGLFRPINFTVTDDWVTCIQTEFKYVAVDIYHELTRMGKLTP